MAHASRPSLVTPVYRLVALHCLASNSNLLEGRLKALRPRTPVFNGHLRSALIAGDGNAFNWDVLRPNAIRGCPKREPDG